MSDGMDSESARVLFAVIGLIALAIAIPMAVVLPDRATPFVLIAIAAVMFLREAKS